MYTYISLPSEYSCAGLNDFFAYNDWDNGHTRTYKHKCVNMKSYGCLKRFSPLFETYGFSPV